MSETIFVVTYHLSRLPKDVVESFTHLRFDLACMLNRCPELFYFRGLDLDHSALLDDYVNKLVPIREFLDRYTFGGAFFNITRLLASVQIYPEDTPLRVDAPISCVTIDGVKVYSIPSHIYNRQVRHAEPDQREYDDGIHQPSSSTQCSGRHKRKVYSPPQDVVDTVTLGVKSMRLGDYGTGDSGVVVDDDVEDGEIVVENDRSKRGALEHPDTNRVSLEYSEDENRLTTNSRSVDVYVNPQGEPHIVENQYVDPSTPANEQGASGPYNTRVTRKEMNVMLKAYADHVQMLKDGIDGVDGNIVINNQYGRNDINAANGKAAGLKIIEKMSDPHVDLCHARCTCSKMTGRYKDGKYTTAWSNIQDVCVYRANANSIKVTHRTKLLATDLQTVIPIVAVLSDDRILIDTSKVFGRLPVDAPLHFKTFPGIASDEAINFTKLDLEEHRKAEYVEIKEGVIGSVFKWISENISVTDMFIRWGVGALYVKASGTRITKAIVNPGIHESGRLYDPSAPHRSFSRSIAPGSSGTRKYVKLG